MSSTSLMLQRTLATSFIVFDLMLPIVTFLQIETLLQKETDVKGFAYIDYVQTDPHCHHRIDPVQFPESIAMQPTRTPKWGTSSASRPCGRGASCSSQEDQTSRPGNRP